MRCATDINMLIFVHIIQAIYGNGTHTSTHLHTAGPVVIHQIASIIVYIHICNSTEQNQQKQQQQHQNFPLFPNISAPASFVMARRNTREMVIYHIYLGRTSCTCTGARVQDPNAICFAPWLSSILWPQLETG